MNQNLGSAIGFGPKGFQALYNGCATMRGKKVKPYQKLAWSTSCLGGLASAQNIFWLHPCTLCLYSLVNNSCKPFYLLNLCRLSRAFLDTPIYFKWIKSSSLHRFLFSFLSLSSFYNPSNLAYLSRRPLARLCLKYTKEGECGWALEGCRLRCTALRSVLECLENPTTRVEAKIFLSGL